MELISYEKSYVIDASSVDVDIRDLQESNQFVAMGLLITRGSNDTEDVVGTLAGGGGEQTFNLKVGEVHRLKFANIAPQGDGTTAQEIKIVGV